MMIKTYIRNIICVVYCAMSFSASAIHQNETVPDAENFCDGIYSAKQLFTGGGLVAFGTITASIIQALQNCLECCDCCPCNRARKQREHEKEMKKLDFEQARQIEEQRLLHAEYMEQVEFERTPLEQLVRLLLDQFVNDFDKYQETIQRLSPDTQAALRVYGAKTNSPILSSLDPMRAPAAMELSRERMDEGKEKIDETVVNAFSAFLDHAQTQLLARKPVDKGMLEKNI